MSVGSRIGRSIGSRLDIGVGGEVESVDYVEIWLEVGGNIDSLINEISLVQYYVILLGSLVRVFDVEVNIIW